MDRKHIEAIYKLSPQQQGMLFETLAAAASDIYIEQEIFPWRGALNATAFEQAWQRVLERHAMLRTAFAWREHTEPLQIVLQHVSVPIARRDWRGLPPAEQRAALAAYLKEDRRRGFDLSRAPLMRLVLLQMGDEAYQIVWTFHHILMDGWCLPIVEAEFHALYAAFSAGRNLQLKPARSYRDYVAWVMRQDLNAAEVFWRQTLQGCIRPTALGRPGGRRQLTEPSERYGTREARLPAALTAQLVSCARRHRLTPNTVLQGLWAVLLSRYSGDDVVLFGTTVSGRPTELDGVAGMVGLFINTIPFRVQLIPDRTVTAWLSDLQNQHLELRQYQYCSTGQIHQWSAMPGALPLYESVLVFENYPDDAPRAPSGVPATPVVPESPSAAAGSSAAHDEVPSFIGAHTRFPLTLLAAVRSELLCRFVYDRVRLDEAVLDRMVEHVCGLLKSLIADSEQSVARLRDTIPGQEVPQVGPAPHAYTPGARLDFVAPRTPTEEILARTWAALLGLERLSVQQNFFELGGHSLLATQLMSHVRSAFGIELPLRCLFESPTVAGLAASIDATRREKQGLAAPPIVPVPRDSHVPLSFSQERLWFLHQLLPDTTVYNIPAAWRLRGRLDTLALAHTLHEVVRRHEVLRTAFHAADGQPFQRIAPSLQIELPMTDLTELPPHRREAEALRLATAEAGRPFDLARGPLLRAAVLRLDHEEHVLLLTMHHIVSDGWSMGVLFREVAALYESFCTGQPSPLPELPIQYADFAVWQRHWLQGAVLETQLAYWRQCLQGMPAHLALPADYPRPKVQTFRGADAYLALPKRLSAALQALSQREGVTLFMTLLAAFNVLLCRYSGQEDIAVGTPIAGRNRAEIEGLIGFFINTLVLRTDLSGAPNFRALLHRVREVALGAYVHQDLPFERLLEEVRPARDLGRTPLFQVFFNLLNYAGGGHFHLHGLDVESFAAIESGARFDLTLYASERNDYIQLYVVYNPDLFNQGRMVELLAQYENLLYEIVAEPEKAIASFSLVTEASRPYLPDPTATLDAGCGPPVHILFAQQAQRVPDRPAVVDAHRTWTYGELDVASTELAGALRAAGIGPGGVVAIYSCRDGALVAALLGVLKAGAAFMMLDAAYPAARAIACLHVAPPCGWIQLEAAGALPEALARWVQEAPLLSRITVSGPARGVASARSAWDEASAAVSPDDLAYIAFTSGTTGTPKAIAGTHRPLSHFIAWHSQTFAFSDADHFSMLSGLAHDPLLRDVFTPLSLGATLHILDPDDVGSSQRLLGWLSRAGISVMHLTPTMGRLLSAADPQTPGALAAVRHAFFGGEVLTRRDVAAFRRLAPTATVVNFYGATETPQAMAFCIVDGADDTSQEQIPLGRGIQDVQLLVLNATGDLAGVGELGEIYVRTPHLSRGYLGDEALNAARFMVNPFTSDVGDRLYRTGDLGRYLPHGSVDFAGRSDSQVKIRGFRIEPGDVEAALEVHPNIRQSAVVVQDDQAGEPSLVAHVVRATGAALTTGEVRRFLREKLPDYMVPVAIVLTHALPLLPNGKVDRHALALLDTAGREPAEEYVPPRTPLEKELTGIWADVLRLHRVGIHDNFFALGGHSLLASRLISRLRSALQVELPLRRLFEAPTVARLAAVLRDIEASGQKLPVRTLAPTPREHHRAWIDEHGELVLPESLHNALLREGQR